MQLDKQSWIRQKISWIWQISSAEESGGLVDPNSRSKSRSHNLQLHQFIYLQLVNKISLPYLPIVHIQHGSLFWPKSWPIHGAPVYWVGCARILWLGLPLGGEGIASKAPSLWHAQNFFMCSLDGMSIIEDSVSNMAQSTLEGDGKALVWNKTEAETDFLLDIIKVALAWGANSERWLCGCINKAIQIKRCLALPASVV